MDHRAKLVAFTLAAVSASAQAGYAQLSPPTGFAQSAPGSFTLNTAAANASSYNNRAVLNVTTNVGGRAVTIPASMRFASNAGQIAMNAVRLNPATLALSVVAAFVLPYGLEYVADEWRKWDERMVAGYLYSMTLEAQNCAGKTSEAAAGSCVAGKHNALWPQNSGSGSTRSTRTDTYTWTGCAPASGAYSCNFSVHRTVTYPERPDWNSSTTFPTNAASASRAASSVPEAYVRPAVDDDFIVPDGEPLPDGLPEVLPVPLPVELPIINPSADPLPVAEPLRVPLGAPEAIPGTLPQEWRQPVTDIVPWNTPAEPWRVDLQPKYVASPDSTGQTDPQTVGGGSPAAVTPETQTDCDKYPENSACKPLGVTPVAPEVETKHVPLSITPVSGFGPSTAACPAPRTVTLAAGYSISMPFTLLCDFANGIRPIVIAVAWISAAFGFMGLARKGE